MNNIKLREKVEYLIHIRKLIKQKVSYVHHLDFHNRKLARTIRYFKYEYGMRLKDCTACNGSGYYDSCGSPDCGACDGTGKETYCGVNALFLKDKDKRKHYKYNLTENDKRLLDKLEEIEDEIQST